MKTIHNIRRTNGSYQAIIGLSLIIICKSLAHKSAQQTEVYTRMNNDPARESFKCATADILRYGNIVNKNTEGSSEK